jgi:DNA polymerase-3 subunit alpha
MQAAHVLAGNSLGEADLIRLAMGKKVKAEMDAQRQRFVDGCASVSQIDARRANELFDLIDKFAGYGFNKSHAAAYALLAYQTGWLKAHYPEEFFAASMCFDMDQSEKLAVFVDDARRSGVEIAPPDVNRSEAEFTVERTDDGYAVRYALAGIKGVGEKAMEALVAEREANGWYESVEDLFGRLPKGSMNSRQLEGLIAAGALDTLDPDRARLFGNVDLLLAVTEAANRERESGQGGLFGGEAHADTALRLREAPEWSRAERMAKERENFGFYFSAHPVEQYRAVASANGARSYASLMEGGAPAGGRAQAVMAAMVEKVSRGRTRRGKDFVRADFSDSSGQFSAACFEESLVSNFVKWAEDGTSVLLNVELDSPSPDEAPRITVRGARPLRDVKAGARMLLTLDVLDPGAIALLRDELQSGADGRGEVRVRLRTGGAREPQMILGRSFQLDGDLAERLAALDGFANVQLSMQRAPSLRLVA